MQNTAIQHRWDLTYHEAVRLQEKLNSQVEIQVIPIDHIQYVAAADISYQKKNPILYAAVLLFSLPNLQLVEEHTGISKAEFPYIPGLLSFREVPALLPLFHKLRQKPDVVLVDGQGIAHPRYFGLASHLGVLLNMTTIGCAKTRLVGKYERVPKEKGDWAPLQYHGEEIGRVLCTRSNVKPLFISIGHKVDLETSTKIVMKTVTRYRSPEPIRAAHKLVNRIRKENTIPTDE